MSKQKQSLAKPAGSPSAPEYRKPRADVYTVLLVIALIMVLVATAALWMSMNEYQNMIKGGPTPVWQQPAAGTMFDSPHGIA